MADPADLDARAVVLQAVLELALHRAVVAVLVHVDEVDHDKARKVAQPHLPRDLFRRFEIGLQRRLFDVPLFRGAARVDVDRDQRFRRIDHDVAAGLQRHRRFQHRVELLLDPELSGTAPASACVRR